MKSAISKTRKYNGFNAPKGSRISFVDGAPVVPDNPIIPFIEGDGIGPEIWLATRRVVDAAVASAYGGKRNIAWFEIFAGGKAKELFDNWLPDDSVDAIADFGVAIKGPLNTPSGGGFRSLNVRLRQTLDLYSCIRPIHHIEGVPSVLKAPEKLDVVIFRENTEDVYAGIEYQAGTEDALKVAGLLSELGTEVREGTGIGIKIISKEASRRLVRRAIQYAIDHGRKSVTLVHKGNIQKYTEGAFSLWGYELAKEEFGDLTITEKELWDEHDGVLPEGKVLVNDRIADAIFYELLINPEKYSVIATTNLNGDYLSDACAAQVGGLGVAPGANIGDTSALFEAVHGTAPTIAGKNIANPTSLLLSALMMLEYMGWDEAAAMVHKALSRTIGNKRATGDLTRLMDDARALSTSEFADALIAELPAVEAKEQLVGDETKNQNVVPAANTRGKRAMPKVSVIGAGGVGATCAQYIANMGLADVVLLDIQEGIPQGKGLDLLQAGALLGSDARIHGTNDYADTVGSDIVVITAGIARKPGMSRDDLLKTNATIVQEVAHRAFTLSPEAIFLVVTNPLDVMTYLVWKTTGLPSAKVIGMAGALDSARFKAFIAEALDVSVVDIQAMVLGGHGDLMVPLPRYSTVSGIPITELMDAEKIEALCARTRDGGAEIVSHLKTGSAFYAPGASVTMMVESILKDSHRLIPSSVHVGGAYGIKGDLFIGLPTVLCRHGVHGVVEIKLRRDEKRALKASAKTVQGTIETMETLLG
ncbi:MAG: isocitrate dehydrogenase (NADP(+)) [Candidatus Obscuribacterales bacterium]|nr:isocitrate dehydrogenase (NADP(+)) [Cyanobacteria bacterium HKST-UBA01]MCB9467476.1 isocitrate dehydrogenase (NADP(+)) [Candidatus Obscuribacterales bacterium]